MGVQGIEETLIPVPSRRLQNRLCAEITRRQTQVNYCHTETKNIVAEAKTQLERMILGEMDQG